MRTVSTTRGGETIVRRGFTLTEVVVTVLIVGVGFVSVMTAVNSGTKINETSTRLTQAVFLAQEIREWTLAQSTNLASITSATYSPPRNSLGQTIAGMTGWSQVLTVSYRSASDVKTVVASGSSDVMYVRLVVRYSGQDILTTGWLVVKRG